MHRRRFVATAAVAAAALSARASQPESGPGASRALKGRLRQSVCRWCYSRIPLDDLCAAAAAIGLRSVELLNPDEWPVTARHGLICALASYVPSNPIPRGLNRQANHAPILKELEARLPLAKAAGIPSQIVFSGNRDGLSDREGIDRCIEGLRRITPLAEQLGITLVMELLNSKVDHKDYQCDRTWWGVEVVRGVGSPRFKLLYDIYHMQIMEGDVIRTVTDHFEHIGHYHTGGVPGRAEIDATQELNYPAICRAIVEKGFDGYLAQEFVPRRDPLDSLRQAVELCDI
jgi:hydroxypyruvate isomerase